MLSLLECGVSNNSVVNDLSLNILLNTAYKTISTTPIQIRCFQKFHTKMLYSFVEVFEQATHIFLLSGTIRPFTCPSHLQTVYLSVCLPINLFIYRIIFNNSTLEHLHLRGWHTRCMVQGSRINRISESNHTRFSRSAFVCSHITLNYFTVKSHWEIPVF